MHHVKYQRIELSLITEADLFGLGRTQLSCILAILRNSIFWTIFFCPEKNINYFFNEEKSTNLYQR